MSIGSALSSIANRISNVVSIRDGGTGIEINFRAVLNSPERMETAGVNNAASSSSTGSSGTSETSSVRQRLSTYTRSSSS